MACVCTAADTSSSWQRMSAIGTKRTSACALHMSAFDPKRTLNVGLTTNKVAWFALPLRWHTRLKKSTTLIWIVDLPRGRLVGKIKLTVTFCLVGETQIGCGQIFQLGAHLQIAFSFGPHQEFKSLGAIIVPRGHAEAPMPFYAAPPGNTAFLKSFRELRNIR